MRTRRWQLFGAATFTAVAVALATGGSDSDGEVTFVRASANMGEFDIQLLDPWTPATASNFLGYVERGDYTGTFIHRSIPGFMVQVGGYRVQGNEVTDVVVRAPVTNEAHFSNVRGTVAMAKLGGDPNSATSEWFVNLSDNNAANLDYQNGGFTVFGVVLGNGMAVVDSMAAVPVYDASPAWGAVFSNLPLLNPLLEADNLLTFQSFRRLAAGTQVFPFDFAASDEGFVAGFADLPADFDSGQYNLQSRWTNLPANLGGKPALFISGVNRSDDLFMFWKRKAVGLIPGMVYEATFDLELATSAAEGMVGIGGAPGESVFLKAGMSPTEPRAVADGAGWLRLNVDKGNQSQGGAFAAVLGHAAKPDDGSSEFAVILRDNRASRVRATSGPDGSLWFFFGSDSGFEGATGLYYRKLTAVLEPVGQQQSISFAALPRQTFSPKKTFSLVASNSSGLPVEFISANSNIVSVKGDVATIKSAGSVAITATNAGDIVYNPAGVTRTINIVRARQSITFNPATSQKFKKGRTFKLMAVSSSKLPITFRSDKPKILSIKGNVATMRAKGVVKITASQGGNANYRAAKPIPQTIEIK
jgi:cyclophilin family peptidyl-prolyl cis-trans isomerase